MDLQQLTLQDLRILRSLYRTHSQKETALALGLSSPTLSRRIAEMRDLFGDKLFVRYANTMMPTPFMVEHMPAVERLVEGMRDLCEPSWFDPSSHQEVIRIGCIDYDLFSGLSVRTAFPTDVMGWKKGSSQIFCAHAEWNSPSARTSRSFTSRMRTP